MIDEKEVLKILKRYEGRMNPTAYFSLEADIVNIEEAQTFKWCTDCKEYDQEKHCCHRWSKVIRDTVEEMKQEPRWIPISEKLPEKNVEVLATTEWGAVTIAEMYSVNDWFIHEGATNAETDEIVAWMPLPKPFEPQESEVEDGNVD